MKPDLVYQPTLYGDPIGPCCSTLTEAVCSALTYDGFGLMFLRGDDDWMYAYTSGKHIGNNPYIPQPSDAWKKYGSDLLDDNEAIDEVCMQLFTQAPQIHDRYAISIATYDLNADQ